MMIHFIGDSHSSFFSGVDIIQPEYPFPSNDTISSFKTYRLGPVLAYSLSKYNTSSKGREKLFEIIDTLPEKSYVVLCFGEIDCRYHLLFQSNKLNIPLEDIIDDCLNQYFSAVLEIKRKGHRIGIWGATPTSYINSNPLFPSYGTHVQRNDCTKQFNIKLEQLCKQNDVLFFSIFNTLVGKNLHTPNYIFFDGVHLGQIVMPLALKQLKKCFPEIKTKKNWKSNYIQFHVQKTTLLNFNTMTNKIKNLGRKIGLSKTYHKLKNLLFPPIQVPEYSEKRSIILSYQQIFKTKTFIETGTFMGDTIEALKNDFDYLYSIELSEELALRATKRFEDSQKVRIIQGDSGMEIESLIQDIKEPMLFWLDGHYSGEFMYQDEFIKTAKGSLHTPIEKELQLILTSDQPHVILIDDARLFIGQMDYPTIKQIKEIVKKISKFNHKLSVSRDIIRIVPSKK